jgi:hypothetical protein
MEQGTPNVEALLPIIMNNNRPSVNEMYTSVLIYPI